jgi:hypothetical protein
MLLDFFDLFFYFQCKLWGVKHFFLGINIARQRISSANLEKEEFVCIFTSPKVIVQNLAENLLDATNQFGATLVEFYW